METLTPLVKMDLSAVLKHEECGCIPGLELSPSARPVQNIAAFQKKLIVANNSMHSFQSGKQDV